MGADPGRRPGRRVVATVLLLLVAVLSACSGAERGGGEEATADAGETEAAADRRRQARFWEVFRAANRARTGGDRGVAIAGYVEALELQPEHADTLHFLAQLRAERGEIGEAARLLERLLEVEDRGIRARQQLSRLLGTPHRGWVPRLEAARETIAPAVRANPQNSGSWMLLARWAAYAGDGTAAMDALEEVRGLHAASGEAWVLSLWMRSAGIAPHGGDEMVAAAVRALCGEGEVADCSQHPVARLALANMAGAEARPGLQPPPAAPVAPAIAAPGAGTATEVSTDRWHQPGAGERRIEIDLDGDGAADLIASAGDEGPVRLAAVDGAPVPGAGLAHGPWEPVESRFSPSPVPWRGVAVTGPEGASIVVAGGGERPLRAYRPRAGDTARPWAEVDSSGLPGGVFGATLAAADWNGDGLTDLFVADLPGEGERAGDGEGAAAADLHGRLLLRRPDGGWEPSGPPMPGSWRAAVALDADGDGDQDLVVGRRLDAERAAAGQLLLAGEEGGTPADPGPVLELWINEGGRLVSRPDGMPSVRCTVADLAVVDHDRDGRPDLFVATGGLEPERVEADRLLRNVGGRFVDASPRLGESRFATTVAAWGDATGLLLLRGGMVPADPARLLLWTPLGE